MTKEQFIAKIAPYIQKYATLYNIKVCSPIIAQAVLESAGGTSELAVNAHNYFGLKYRANRCPSSCGIYYKNGSEQNANGTYTTSAMQWFKFATMELGVKGYFDFINISSYSNLKGVSNPETYLNNIKADGYATSLNYVLNLMNVIKTYNLTQYDKEGSDSMSNSSLICYTKISPNSSNPRNHAIDTITIHCMAGNISIESCGNIFANKSRNASSNYGIGTDGRIALYVDEANRSFCSSNAANDNRAVTIEVANDGGASTGWHVSDKAMESLIKLVADICKRNNIKKLLWQGDKNLIGQVSKQNMTVHRWFAAKACPGDYLYNKHSYIAEEVNKLLGVAPTVTTIPVISNVVIPAMNIVQGNPTQFAHIIMNIKLALNTDYGLSFAINSTIDNILLINLGNIILSSTSYKPNITYALQQLLKWWGYSLTVDGVFGSGTKTIISTFQRQVGIAVTGTTTKDFWYKVLGK